MFNNINIYWINLERAQHRKEKMLNLFQEHNLTHKRIEAIDGLKINENDIKSQYKVNEKMNVFEIACAPAELNLINLFLFLINTGIIFFLFIIAS